MGIRSFLLTICAFGLFHCVRAQVDTEFWFAAPDVSNQHQGDDRPVRFRISTLDESATVEISMPANHGFSNRRITLGPNQTTTVILANASEYENSPPNRVLNKGFHITSTSLVSCFYEVGQRWNVDIFALKGRNAIGQEFIMPNQNFWGIWNGYTDAHSSLSLVATEDRTIVTIIPSQYVIGYSAHDTITVILNRGETYTNYSREDRSGFSLNGTIVKSNKPIAVTLSDDSLEAKSGGCRDLAGDQLVPVGVLGEEHIVAKGALFSDERLFITAVQDSTLIFINGEPEALDTLERGETYNYEVVGLTYVRSTNPVYVMHYTGIGCEIGAALIPSINCKGSNQVGFTRASDEEFYMTVLVRHGGEQSFTLNGNAFTLPPDSFVPVPGTNAEWMISSLPYDQNAMPAGLSYLLKNEDYSFQLGILDGGRGTGTRYGYFSNFASLFIGDDFTLCTGAEREIIPKGEPGASYLWNDGSTNPTLTVAEAGDYWVSMTNSAGCTLTDTLTVEVNPESFLKLDSLAGGCQGDVVRVDAGVQARYDWSNGTTGRYLNVNQPGIFSVEVLDVNGCIDTDSVEVIFQTKHEVTLGPDLLVCPGTEVSMDATVEDGELYRWNDGFDQPEREVTEPGMYWVDATVGICTVRDTLYLDNHPKPETPTITGTPVVCPGIVDVVYESMDKDFEQFSWRVEGGQITSSEKGSTLVSWGSARNDALVQLVVTDSLNCTSDTSSLPVRINVVLEPPVPLGDTLVCSNVSTVQYEVPTTSGSTYRWELTEGENIGTPGSALANVRWPGDGFYEIQVVEESITTDTVCAGISPPLVVQVFTDSTTIDLSRVTTSLTDDKEIQVFWTVSDPAGLSSDLELSRTAENEMITLSLDPRLTVFQDFDLPTQSTSFAYNVSAINRCDQQLETPMHNTIVLSGTGEEDMGLISLVWNDYLGWQEAPDYELWRRMDRDEDFTFFRRLEPKGLAFADTIATDGFVHRYRVKAVGESDEQFSWSNIVQFSFEHELVIPNVFTPNGDGLNDQFVIDNIDLYENNLLEVFSRQGGIVYRSAGYKNDWDGASAPAGQYFYRLEIGRPGLTYTGPLTILK